MSENTAQIEAILRECEQKCSSIHAEVRLHWELGGEHWSYWNGSEYRHCPTLEACLEDLRTFDSEAAQKQRNRKRAANLRAEADALERNSQ